VGGRGSVSFGAEIAEVLKPENEREFIEQRDRLVEECYRTDL
jgi:hypothetical protein